MSPTSTKGQEPRFHLDEKEELVLQDWMPPKKLEINLEVFEFTNGPRSLDVLRKIKVAFESKKNRKRGTIL